MQCQACSARTAGVFHVVRLDLVAETSALTVRWRSDVDPVPVVATYRIGTPAVTTTRVTDVTHEHPPWACPYDDEIGITLIGCAIAYRLDWDDGTSTVLPPNAPWRTKEDDEERLLAPPHTIWVGAVACRGSSVDGDRLPSYAASGWWRSVPT